MEPSQDIAETETTLLFLDTLSHPSLCFNSDEILFKQPVVLELIRVLKPDSNPHPTLKSFPSATQVGPVKTFEVFAKNLDAPSDRFELVLDSCTINENPEMDTLVPLVKKLKTDHLILRGEYEKLSVAIYGQLLPPEEVALILSKQFDMPQQAAFILKKKDEVSPLLSESDEQILSDARKSAVFPTIPVATPMADIAEPTVDQTIESNLGKIEAQTKAVLDVYSYLVSSPPPTNFCALFQDLVASIEAVLETIKMAPTQSWEPPQKDLEKILPIGLVTVCISGLKGEINSFAEAGLAIRLCKSLAVAPLFVHELLAQGVLQHLADIMLQCKSSGLRTAILEAVYALIGQEEAATAVQQQVLTIKNKPETIPMVPEETKEPVAAPEESEEERHKSKKKGKDHEHKKHKHDSKEREKKHSKKHKSHHKREEKEEPAKMKKVVANPLGEIIEGEYQVQTLYQLILALLMAKQGSVVVKAVKKIVEKVEFVGGLKRVRDSSESKGVLLYCMESVFAVLADNESNQPKSFSNETAMMLQNYDFIPSLLHVLEKSAKAEDETFLVWSATRILKWFIASHNGLAFLERHNVSDVISRIAAQFPSMEGYVFAGIKDPNAGIGLDQFEAFRALKNTGRLDREELLARFTDMRIFDEPVNERVKGSVLIREGSVSVPINGILIGHVKEAIAWRLWAKSELDQVIKGGSNHEIAGKLHEIMVGILDREIVSEAVADILWEECPLPRLFASIQEHIIKQHSAEGEGFIQHVDSIVETIKTTREKMEADEFPSHLTGELKEAVETLLIWLEAYNSIKPSELGELVKTLWTNLPTASAMNIAFHDTNAPNFLKQLFGAAYTLPQGLSPFFLGSSDTRGSAVIFFKNAYRCLSNLLDANPAVLVRMLDSGLLSHIKHLVLSLSACFQQWNLPTGAGNEIGEGSAAGLFMEDYYQLLFQVVKVFRKVLPRVLISAKSYDDPTMVTSLFSIFPHALHQSLSHPSDTSSSRLYVSIIKETLSIFAAWFKQENFVDSVFLPRIAEMLADLPEKRFAGYYLLIFVAAHMTVKDPAGLETLQKMLKSSNPFAASKPGETKAEEDKTHRSDESVGGEAEAQPESFAAFMIKRYGTVLSYVLNKMYESHDATFIAAGISMVKFLANVLPPGFAEQLTEEFVTAFAPYVSTSQRPGELEFAGTPTSRPNSRLIHALTKRLRIFRETIPTLCKYSILKSTLPETLVGMLRSMGGTESGPQDVEKALLETIREILHANPELLEGRTEKPYAVYEVLPSSAQMQKIMGTLSQKALIDPPTFTALAGGSLKGSLIVEEYLRTIGKFVETIVGRAIILFGDHTASLPMTPKVSVCFKELIDQCHELLKLGVPVVRLYPVIGLVLDIAVELLTTTYDANGLKSGTADGASPGEVPTVFIHGVACVLAGDLSGIPKLMDRLKDFLSDPQLGQKWQQLDTYFSILGTKEYIPETNVPIFKPRPLEDIYRSYYGDGDRTVPGRLLTLLKPKTLKRAESIYFIKRGANGYKSPREISLVNDIVKTSCFDKLQDDWLVERIFAVESVVLNWVSDPANILVPELKSVQSWLNTVSEPEPLQMEHANLPLSVQTMKRKQREEVEKKRKNRTKPSMAAAAKLVPFSPAQMAPRKPTAQQPSRNISTHVDVFEGLDKGLKNPFPQLQKPPSGKPGTPTHTVPSVIPPFIPAQPPGTPTERPPLDPMRGVKSPVGMGYIPGTPTSIPPPPPPPPEEKLVAPPAPAASKYQDLINLLNALPKGESKPAFAGPRPMEIPRRPFMSAPVPEAAANFQDLFAKLTSSEARPPVRPFAPPPAATMSPITSPMSTPIVPMHQLTDEERDAFREVQFLRLQRPNDPRTQERISKLLRQYPRVAPHFPAGGIIKKP